MKWLSVALVLFFAAGFGLLALGNQLELEQARELWANGKVSEGTVVEQYRRRRTYTYTYRVEDSELTAERRSIPWAAGEFPVGAKIVVRYDPATPGRSMTAAELLERENWGNRGLLPVLALGFLGLAIWLGLPSKKKAPPSVGKPPTA